MEEGAKSQGMLVSLEGGKSKKKQKHKNKLGIVAGAYNPSPLGG